MHGVNGKGGKVEVFFVNGITVNEKLSSPVALTAHDKIPKKPPAGRFRPAKGFDASKDLLWLLMWPSFERTIALGLALSPILM
jgi:hypothetical protein